MLSLKPRSGLGGALLSRREQGRGRERADPDRRGTSRALPPAAQSRETDGDGDFDRAIRLRQGR